MADANEKPAPIAPATPALASTTPRADILVPDPKLRTNYGDYDDHGVDLSLLRYVLALSPLERLQLMERHAQATRLLNDHARQHREAESRRHR